MERHQHINTADLTYRGETQKGEEFGRLIIASADNGKQFFRILFDQHGNPAANTEQVQALNKFFGLRFTPALLDGTHCLAQIEDL